MLVSFCDVHIPLFLLRAHTRRVSIKIGAVVESGGALIVERCGRRCVHCAMFSLKFVELTLSCLSVAVLVHGTV